MSTNSICPHCGYSGPVDAQYCAQCGRTMDQSREGWTGRFYRNLSTLSPFHIGLIGLALSIAISVLADRMIVTILSFRLLLVPLALILGGGYAALGWQWLGPLSNGSRLGRMLVVFIGMGVLLLAVWLVDRGMLSMLSDSTHQVVYALPGVYVEASPGFRHLSIAPDVPPYWLLALIYGGLATAAGNYVRRAQAAAGG